MYTVAHFQDFTGLRTDACQKPGKWLSAFGVFFFFPPEWKKWGGKGKKNDWTKTSLLLSYKV